MPRKKVNEKRAKHDEDNPEALPSQPNSLFGSASDGSGAGKSSRKSNPAGPPPAAALKEQADAASPQRKRPRPQMLKEDPAVAMVRAQKRHKQASGGSGSGAAGKGPSSAGSPAEGQRSARPHAAAVDEANKMWERLRSDKTDAEERARLIDDVLTLFEGKTMSVLQKHDAARVLQSCFKNGSAAQRDRLMKGITGEVYALACSHYGHSLLISILRHGSSAHKQLLFDELKAKTGELLVHSEGSAVLQLLYSEVATGEQKNEMYRALWSKEMALFDSGGNLKLTSLAQLFEADPLCKSRVLHRLEILLSKAARKGLAITTLVQRAAAEMLEHGDASQRAELVASFREQAVHVMHTRDGARIACGCLRHGDAKDRKAVLKAMKGYVSKAALDPHGALVLSVALEAVDDTVLLSKSLLAELQPELLGLSLHPHGNLPILQVLAPRSKTHFSASQLDVMGDIDPAASKKDPAQRRTELLATLLPAILKLSAAHAATLACSTHGAAVLYESLRVATGGEEGLGLEADALSAHLPPLFRAIADAAVEPPPSREEDEGTTAAAYADVAVVAHPYGARLLKKLVQAHEGLALELRTRLAGKLSSWATRGAGWVVLALLENRATSQTVRDELAKDAAALSKSSAPGCRSLSQALPPPPTQSGTVEKKKKKRAGKA